MMLIKVEMKGSVDAVGRCCLSGNVVAFPFVGLLVTCRLASSLVQCSQLPDRWHVALASLPSLRWLSLIVQVFQTLVARICNDITRIAPSSWAFASKYFLSEQVEKKPMCSIPHRENRLPFLLREQSAALSKRVREERLRQRADDCSTLTTRATITCAASPFKHV